MRFTTTKHLHNCGWHKDLVQLMITILLPKEHNLDIVFCFSIFDHSLVVHSRKHAKQMLRCMLVKSMLNLIVLEICRLAGFMSTIVVQFS